MSFTSTLASMWSTLKSILKKIFIAAFLILAAGLAFSYWGTYETGLRAGVVLRISEKGILFKTYEGQLNLETFGSLKDASPIKESFEFSVESDATEVIRELQAVALSGERVNLHYVKRYVAVPWRGETKYFVTQVERRPHE